MAPTLIGPPAERRRRPQNPTTTTTTTPDDEFINLMISNFNTTQPESLIETKPNPCVDLFFNIVPGTPVHSLIRYLNQSWSHNPLTTLKLICNLRDVRGTGKSDKKAFYNAAIWLHQNHPRTLACNLASLSQFGYFKDFPHILFKVLGLSHVKKMSPTSMHGKRLRTRVGRAPFPMKKKKSKNNSIGMKLVRMREAADRQVIEKEKASELRHKNKTELAKQVLLKYERDPDFRFLHERVSDVFAERLRSDMKALNEGKLNKISLASKWCPSLDSCYDRATLLCEAIARKLFPKEVEEEYDGVEEVHYAYRVRDRLRKQVLVPLRKALELPEVFMGGNKWNEVKYNRVPSVAMKNYKEFFLKHDEDRFNGYLEDVKNGKEKIAAGALLPHEIVAGLKDGDGGDVAELQWKRMVEDLRKEGILDNCISICDVSSSMEGTPMEVGISLSLLLSELSKEPWKGKVITFSENPQLHFIQGDDLYSKANFIKRMKWGENADFQRVFDLILAVAVHGKLNPEQMIKKVFVFSDMDFDKAYLPDGRVWESDYMAVRKKFEENGFGEAVPEFVFWNLRDSRATPVTKRQKGVALVSGFSKNAMKLFLQGKQGDPEAVMEAAIAGDEYKNLVVMD